MLRIKHLSFKNTKKEQVVNLTCPLNIYFLVLKLCFKINIIIKLACSI